MGTAFRSGKTFPASWGAFSDVDAFLNAVLDFDDDGTSHSTPSFPFLSVSPQSSIPESTGRHGAIDNLASSVSLLCQRSH
jgi:hypothetical protein